MMSVFHVAVMICHHYTKMQQIEKEENRKGGKKRVKKGKENDKVQGK